MMTTKSVGMDTETANPKPVRHINWCGQPMKEGESYWGESKPQEPKAAPEKSATEPQPRSRKSKRNPNPNAWSLEARAAYSKRMKAWWQAKKAKSTTSPAEVQPEDQ